ncbi:phosphomethylpyrimidine kinase [Enterococcus sp. AZ150]|uniref:Hydroxymethylpyrimidine/phosphomethylpyrimidine kinase n=1 Tax=Enterococcus sulfureus ATCC 49903 TaxID=1140003 RepID=S0L8G4_9ENTE|nr:bifunctional hydroxymethylpyrimidine kinase/phosphomethylpyrimidine kinase [Enterococcus sulfureus]EOT48648.1 phosphomethylpyrimidine kinase [Enterococcus sulfureus ATCC 49903]EOT87540.1 phosphomethylpyrimidine kinase [Enterococcus sulfureus ATCC 49903]
MIACACTIAGSDSGGGAGIQADLKTFQGAGVYGTSVITAVTAQNTVGVYQIEALTPTIISAQLNAIQADFPIQAYKTGMLFDATIIKQVAKQLDTQNMPIVVDPVMIAKGGASLLQLEAIEALKTNLLPIATICTPNLPEAEIISGIEITDDQSLQQAAKKILELGVQTVIMKGGHATGTQASDTVFSVNESPYRLSTPRYETKHTHGTGCTFSAAITAHLAQGMSVKPAIIEAKKFIDRAIFDSLNLGHGHGPTNHFAYKKSGGVVDVQLLS